MFKLMTGRRHKAEMDALKEREYNKRQRLLDTIDKLIDRFNERENAHLYKLGMAEILSEKNSELAAEYLNRVNELEDEICKFKADESRRNRELYAALKERGDAARDLRVELSSKNAQLNAIHQFLSTALKKGASPSDKLCSCAVSLSAGAHCSGGK